MVNDWVEIEIVNWEKYNPKRDQKTYTWLRLDNGIITDPELFGLSAEQKLLWIALLCEASKKNSGTIRVHLGWLEQNLGLKQAKVMEALTQFQIKPLIVVHTTAHDRARSDDVVTTTPTYVRTNETYERTNVATATSATATAEEPSRIKPVWEKYKSAFEGRYGEAPPWNAKTAGMLKQLIARIPEAEAPEVAAFYLTHGDAFYMKSMHPVGLMLRDIEKLRTEWITGRKVTLAGARIAEAKDANTDAMREYLKRKGGQL